MERCSDGSQILWLPHAKGYLHHDRYTDDMVHSNSDCHYHAYADCCPNSQSRQSSEFFERLIRADLDLAR